MNNKYFEINIDISVVSIMIFFIVKYISSYWCFNVLFGFVG